VALLAVIPNQAMAQDSTEEAAQPSEVNKGLDFDEIIVTGTSTGKRKFETSYAISTLDAEELQRIAPLSTADLLGQIPGIFAESTGGEASNVYRVRGIPNEGSFQTFQEDGIPLYSESAGFFFTGDGIQRTDIMTERYEVVRGGPAPVFATNASAIYNLITRQGGDEMEGSVRVTLGDTGLYRGEGYISGPLAENTYFAVGGFYRHHDGYRENGFPSDKGGQVRLNLRHVAGDIELRAHVKYFNDTNVFYLPIPLADPRNPAVSLNRYFDFFEGTLNTPTLADGGAVLKYRGPNGALVTESRSLDDGRHTEYVAAGFEVDFNVADWLELTNKTRYTKGNVNLDALYSATPPAGGDTFAASQLAAAQTAFGPGVTRLGYALAGSNGVTVYDPNADSGLIVQGQYRAISTDFESFASDLRANFEFNLLGRHELTAGVYFASYDSTAEWRSQNYLLEVRSNPRLLDLVAYGATGNVLGFVTDNGVVTYSNTLLAGRSQITEWNFFANETWHLTDRLSIEGGLRHTTYDGDGFNRATATVNLGIANSLADNATRAYTGVNTPRAFSQEHTAWTAGANWEALDWLSVYVRASRAYRGPSEFNLILPVPATTTSAEQYEAGVKVNLPRFSMFATAFQSKFDPFTATLFELNPQTGQQGLISFIGSVESPGVEVDFSWQPIDFFRLDGAVTYNDAELGNFVSATGAQAVSAEGNLPIRQPAWYGNIRPSVNFDLADGNLDIYARVNFVGRRFVDLQNRTTMDPYQTLAAGITFTRGPVTFQLVGDNLTNSRGITEGNPRTDQIAGQGAAEVIYGRPLFGRNVRLSATYSW
jgi:outer membrane receptor protein involved in Fe transport